MIVSHTLTETGVHLVYIKEGQSCYELFINDGKKKVICASVIRCTDSVDLYSATRLNLTSGVLWIAMETYHPDGMQLTKDDHLPNLN